MSPFTESLSSAAICKGLEVRLNGALSQHTFELSEALYRWLAVEARKKEVPDLAERLASMKKRFEALSANARFEVRTTGIVIKATGDSGDTLQMLSRGTDWFDPVDGLEKLVVEAIFQQQ